MQAFFLTVILYKVIVNLIINLIVNMLHNGGFIMNYVKKSFLSIALLFVAVPAVLAMEEGSVDAAAASAEETTKSTLTESTSIKEDWKNRLSATATRGKAEVRAHPYIATGAAITGATAIGLGLLYKFNRPFYNFVQKARIKTKAAVCNFIQDYKDSKTAKIASGAIALTAALSGASWLAWNHYKKGKLTIG